MTDLADLRARVEEANGPDRESDARLWTWLNGWTFRKVCHLGHTIGGQPTFSFRTSDGDKALHVVPAYTASLDAVLTLVGEKQPGREGELLNEAMEDMAVRGWRADQPFAPQLARYLLSALLAALPASGSEAKPTSPQTVDAEPGMPPIHLQGGGNG